MIMMQEDLIYYVSDESSVLRKEDKIQYIYRNYAINLLKYWWRKELQAFFFAPGEDDVEKNVFIFLEKLFHIH